MALCQIPLRGEHIDVKFLVYPYAAPIISQIPHPLGEKCDVKSLTLTVIRLYKVGGQFRGHVILFAFLSVLKRQLQLVRHPPYA